MTELLIADFKLTPVTASEIEFYMPDAGALLPEFWAGVESGCADAGIKLHGKGGEDGKDQYEISTFPSDPVKTARDTCALREIITKAASALVLAADFSAKPFADRPGSGLHIHVHLADAQGRNVFYKDDIAISTALQHSIGGMLAWLCDCMAVFAPRPESFARFVPGSNAPLTVSWGANNRTVAVRLPIAEHDNKHIEHRVSGADADPYMVMAVILGAIHYGLKNECQTGQQIYGDANLPIYTLTRLPITFEEALERLANSKLFEGYFTQPDLLPEPR